NPAGGGNCKPNPMPVLHHHATGSAARFAAPPVVPARRALADDTRGNLGGRHGPTRLAFFHPCSPRPAHPALTPACRRPDKTASAIRAGPCGTSHTHR